MLRCGLVAPARILRASCEESGSEQAERGDGQSCELCVFHRLPCASQEVSVRSAILGAECNSDLIGEFLQRNSVRGEQWGFLEKIGGVRQVGERALLAFGDGRTLRGKAAGEQEILPPALLYAWFRLLRLAEILTEQVQIIGESTHGIKKLFFGLGYAKCV